MTLTNASIETRIFKVIWEHPYWLMPSLSSLSLDFRRSAVTPSDINSLLEIMGRNAPAVTQFYLDVQHTQFSDANLDVLSACLSSNITHLSLLLGGCSLSDAAIERFLDCILLKTSLKILKLDLSCPSLTERIFLSFARASPSKLHTLHLNLKGILLGPQTLHHLFSYCIGLQNLDLSFHSCALTAQSLTDVLPVILQMQTLQTLTLGLERNSCLHARVCKDLLQTVLMLPVLREVTCLYPCCGIDDSFLSSLHQPPNSLVLSSVRVGLNYSHITNRGLVNNLRPILEVMPNLEKLELLLESSAVTPDIIMAIFQMGERAQKTVRILAL